MNKIQYIKLLEIRGITELNGVTLAQAIKESGGDGTHEEMAKVNELSMKFYIDKLIAEENKNKELIKKNEQLLNELSLLYNELEFYNCLVAAGVDNWEGYNIAQNMMNNEEEE